jgi:hypothetical protein
MKTENSDASRHKVVHATPAEIVNGVFEYLQLLNGPSAEKLGIKFNSEGESPIENTNEITVGTIESDDGIEFGSHDSDIFIKRMRLEKFLSQRLNVRKS